MNISKYSLQQCWCSSKSQTPGNRKPPLYFNRGSTDTRYLEQALSVLGSVAHWIACWTVHTLHVRIPLALDFFLSLIYKYFLTILDIIYVKAEISLLHNVNATKYCKDN